MRIAALAALMVALATACSDGNSPAAPALTITTDSASYTIASGGQNVAVETGFTNTSSSTIWVGSCGAASDPHPGASPAISVYGANLVSSAASSPMSSVVVCDTPIPYALAPGQGVRMPMVIGAAGHYAIGAPYSTSEGGSYAQQATPRDFVVTAAP